MSPTAAPARYAEPGLSVQEAQVPDPGAGRAGSRRRLRSVCSGRTALPRAAHSPPRPLACGRIPPSSPPCRAECDPSSVLYEDAGWRELGSVAAGPSQSHGPAGGGTQPLPGTRRTGRASGGLAGVAPWRPDSAPSPRISSAVLKLGVNGIKTC